MMRKIIDRSIILCKCGCGCKTLQRHNGTWNLYLHGHNRKNIPSPKKGMVGIYSEETLKKMSESHKGLVFSKTHCLNISKAAKGKKKSPEAVEKTRRALTGRKLSKKHIKKSCRNKRPTSLEKKVIAIIKKNNLPYKYVGDGRFRIGRYNPDFVSVNGEKIAIEVYSPFFKNIGDRNERRWRIHRIKSFAEYGWSVIFFREDQLDESNVLFKLKEGY